MVHFENYVISVKDLSVSYKSPTKLLKVLRDLSFDVQEDEFISIIGPSGCGKTTLFNTLAGIEKEDAMLSGNIEIMGENKHNIRRKQKIGVVFQKPTLFEWRTIKKNIQLPLEILGIDKKKRESKAQKLLKLVNLHKYANYRPSQLSGGMQQRVSIARALAFDPEILLMDEPFAALDEIARKKMNDELIRIWKKTKKTILFVTHSIEEAVYLSQKIIILTGQPGQIKKIVKINMDYPRKNAYEKVEFFDYIKRIRKILSD